MKVAFLSDIHANIQAFDACLAHARTQGVQQFALLGDLVGYGADPVAVVQKVQSLAAAGAWATMAWPACSLTLAKVFKAWVKP